ncbi:MAG: prolipoprotein diacylglyceryl transferase family protein, partial [Muribaculaceae bacterium]
ALCYLALFGLLMWMFWKKGAQRRPGLIFGVFLTILFTARFLIEFVKNPQEEFERDMLLNMGQLLSIPFIILGIGLIIYAMKHKALDSQEHVS